MNFTSMTQLVDEAQKFCDWDYDAWLKKYNNGEKKYSKQGCFKINFIAQILATKYAVTDDSFSRLRFDEKVNNYTIGWNLGYMINATNVIPEGKPEKPLISMIAYTILMILMGASIGAGIFMLCLDRKADRRKFDGLAAADNHCLEELPYHCIPSNRSVEHSSVTKN